MQPRQPPASALRLAMLRICQQNGVAYAETAALDGLSGAASCFLQDLAWHARHHAELANRSKVVRTDATEAARGVLPVQLGKNLQGVAEEDDEETAGWVNQARPGNLAVENSGSSLIEREGTGNVWHSQSQELQGCAKLCRVENNALDHARKDL
ncbi:unnamed protein product [Symbiodinium sp. CCMP2456]|nr:unnamed protein product [Symbiodinium sp. CCMP2456]